MTAMTVFDEQGARLARMVEPDAIAMRLARVCVEFEQWPAAVLPPDADLQDVLAAHAPSVSRLAGRYAFRSMDLVTVQADDPDCGTLRGKFLREHTHADCEVRFFVRGRGLFCLHVGDRVYAVLCGAGDFIGIPAGMLHWFDMGSRPDFTSLRLFTAPDGWVAHFTRSDIATRLPDLDALTVAS